MPENKPEKTRDSRSAYIIIFEITTREKDKIDTDTCGSRFFNV